MRKGARTTPPLLERAKYHGPLPTQGVSQEPTVEQLQRRGGLTKPVTGSFSHTMEAKMPPITTSTHTLIIGADSKSYNWHNYTNPAPIELILELGIDPITNRIVAIGVAKATNLITGKLISPRRLTKLVPPRRLLQAIQRYQWAVENDDDADPQLRQLLHNVHLHIPVDN